MLILASHSETRKALLAQAGLQFTSVGAKIDERRLEAQHKANGADGRQIAEQLALAKADAVSRRHRGALVIGADQTLVLDGMLLHKPSSLAEAAGQLDQLRGKTHHLHAGVALVQDGQALWSGVETAQLSMRSFDVSERDAVLEREGAAILGSVGGYRLEGPSIQLFEAMSGDYFTILGLPLLPLLAALRKLAPQVLMEG